MKTCECGGMDFEMTEDLMLTLTHALHARWLKKVQPLLDMSAEEKAAHARAFAEAICKGLATIGERNVDTVTAPGAAAEALRAAVAATVAADCRVR